MISTFRAYLRGDYAIGLSAYGGLLLLLALGWALGEIIPDVVVNLSPLIGPSYAILLTILFFYSVFLPCVAIWTIGAWRSCNRIVRHENRSALAFATKIVICTFISLSLLSVVSLVRTVVKDAASQIVGDPQWGERGVSLTDQGRAIRISGYITTPMPSQLKTLLAKSQNVNAICFDSRGGRFEAAKAIKNIILDYRLDTYVVRECLSACTVAFLGGSHRQIGSSARLGFHGGGLGGKIDMVDTHKLVDEAVSSGVSRDFSEEAYSQSELWFPPSIELEQANVITAIRDGRAC